MRVLRVENERITVETRGEGEQTANLPALLTVEKTKTLRKPRLRSKMGALEVWDAERLGADLSRCGLAGSPTRVIETKENQSGKRKCQMISRDRLAWAIEQGLNKERESTVTAEVGAERLGRVCIVGEAPRGFAESVSDEIVVLPLTDAHDLARRIEEASPRAVLWASDAKSKRVSAEVASMLGLGLCADCTHLACEGGELMMIRPALSGSVIAKIKSLTEPAMATVRTESGSGSRVIVGVGYGVRHALDRAGALADELGAELCASRRLVDNGDASYEAQVGLTGKTVSPCVYIAIGISGAVHHIAGMERAGTVIAINPDKNAPIFEYADYGILAEF
jgi:electron transfer flavoprotein alpha subunit